MNTLIQDKPQEVLLRVSFDIDQLSNRLVWVFDDDGPVTPGRAVVNAFQRYGRHAGAVHFNKGDQLTVHVLGFGSIKDFETFEVTDCTLATVPTAYLHVPPPPSPFGNEHATQKLKFAKPVDLVSKCPELRIRAAHGKSRLTVVEEKGVWDFSLYVTVKITRIEPDGCHKHVLRVFLFDPESEVGTGVTR